MPLSGVDAAGVRVYRGELILSFTDPQARDDLLIRYRSKTRETLRVGVSDLVMTNMRTRKRIRPEDRTVELENRVDAEGYWFADIVYRGVNARNDLYRVSGMVTQYLAGSRRDRRFRVYLEPQQQWRPDRRPPGSSIDWGLDEERVYK